MDYGIVFDTKPRKRDRILFLLIALMLSVFCILKVLRGSDVGSDAEGGIWNYISLFYYPVFLFALFLKRNQKLKISALFVSAVLYVIFAMGSALSNAKWELDFYTFYRFLMIPYAILVFLTFYLCSERSNFGEKIILAGYFFCLALNLFTSINYLFLGAEEAQQSDIYFSLGLFPFAVLFLKKKSIRIVTFVLQFSAVFMVDKRTALISYAVALVLFLLINTRVKGKNKFWNTLGAIVLLIVVFTLFYVVTKYFDDKYNFRIYYRLFRLAEDGGSGRADIYQRIWDGYKQSSIMEKVFGHGMNTAGKIGGASQAHNDFLEILYDYGIINVLFVALFYVSLIINGVRLVIRKSPYAASFALSLVIGLFLAFFSYFLIYFTYVTCIMAFWGYILCMEKKRLIKKGEEKI